MKNHRGRSPDQRKSQKFSKIDIVDQTVKSNKIKITIQDQTQTEVTTQIVTGNCSNSRYYSKDCSRNSSYIKNRN